jgi:hypothetical protein
VFTKWSFFDVNSRAEFVSSLKTRSEMTGQRELIQQQSLKLNELEDKIKLTDEQQSLVKEQLTKLAYASLSSFSVNVEEDVHFEKKIGEGAFGIVYVGTFRGGKVAVKQLVADKVTEENLARFSDEILLMSKLHNPYVRVRASVKEGFWMVWSSASSRKRAPTSTTLPQFANSSSTRFARRYLIQMVGACWEPPNLAIVLEFCQRGDLRQVLKTERDNVDLKIRIRWIQQVSERMK